MVCRAVGIMVVLMIGACVANPSTRRRQLTMGSVQDDVRLGRELYVRLPQKAVISQDPLKWNRGLAFPSGPLSPQSLPVRRY